VLAVYCQQCLYSSRMHNARSRAGNQLHNFMLRYRYFAFEQLQCALRTRENLMERRLLCA
jgi:hypothetical protein